MLPAISFVGHLSGVLLGYAAVRAALLQQAPLLAATADLLRRLEATRLGRQASLLRRRQQANAQAVYIELDVRLLHRKD